MEDLLECPICNLAYNENIIIPRTLPCQHILCTKCLEMIKNQHSHKNYLECPICRNLFTSNLDEIPKSLVTIQLIDAAKRLNITINNQFTNQQNTMPSAPPLPPLPPLPTYIPSSSSSSSSKMTFNTRPNPPPIPPRPPAKKWCLKDYLKSVFHEIDINRDGSITANELQRVLSNVQSNASFSMKTIELLIKKYDINNDGEISFDEFFDLYNNLNDELETFLLIDEDGNGFIDHREFSNSMQRKGYNFSKNFFDFLLNEIAKHTNTIGIRFDTFIRVSARFDFLCNYFYSNSFNNQNKNNHLEKYLYKYFFDQFW